MNDEHHGEILISFPIPMGTDGQPNYALGYEALTKGTAKAEGVVKVIHDLGISGARQTHRIFKHDPVHAANPSAPVAPQKRAAE